MRTVALLALVTSGCGFHVAAAGDTAPPDDAHDAALDTPPDVATVLPTCMTAATYMAGPIAQHRYRKVTNVDYDGAIDACTADGAHLVVNETMAENTFVGTFAGEDSWIGYDDLTTEGTFHWVTGAPSAFVGFSGSEPNDNGTEDCTYTRPDGTWNDTSCGEVRPAICECELGYTPRPTPACRAMTGATVLHGRKYFIRTTALSWTDAKAECEAIGAHLFVPEDNDENDAVDGQFPGDSWVGISDRATEGTWAWVNGSTDTYRDWDLISPGTNTTDNCARLNLDWTDVDCTQLKRYACECDPAPP